VPQSGQIGKAQVQQLGAVLLGKLQDRLRISLCRRHGQAIPPHGEDKCAPQPEEIDCFYAGDKQQLWSQKASSFNSLGGGKRAISIQPSAFSTCSESSRASRHFSQKAQIFFPLRPSR
jgi:hypothetical protein